MATEITFRRGSNDPTSGSGITLAEPVFNTNLHTFHIGLGYGITAEWVGAPITGLSADIAAGITYKIPTTDAVKNYVTGTSITNYVSSFNGLTGAVTGVSAAVAGTGISVSGATGAVTITNTGVQSFNGLTGAVQGVSAAVAGTGISVSGATGAVTITNTGVQSFNGLTGAVQGVSAAVAGTGISVSGATGAVTITNIGVQSFNGATGAVTGVSSIGGFTGTVTFSDGTYTTVRKSSNDISINNVGVQTLLITSGSGINAFTASGTTGTISYTINNTGVTGIQAGTGISVSSTTGNPTITNIGVQSFNGLTGTVQGVSAAVGSTYLTVSGSTGSVTFTNTGVQTFNGLTGAVTGVTVGGTNVFTALNSFNAGISAAGATFSGDIAVNGGDITTTSATATIFNTSATTLSIGSAADSWTIGATSGNAFIRNPSVSFGNDAGGYNYISTIAGTSNTLYLQPFGNLIFAPTTTAASLGSFPSIFITNISAAAGVVSIGGGDLLLGSKTTNDEDYLPVNIIFEGASSEDPPQRTTLTVVDPTANRIITLPDASGTVALTSGLVSSLSGSTYISVSGSTGAVTITNTGVQTFNGLTGAVTGVTVGGTNVFTALNSFNAGISASALTVAGGATFSGNVYLGDSATGVTAESNDYVMMMGGTGSSAFKSGFYQTYKVLAASTNGVICVTPEFNPGTYTTGTNTLEITIQYGNLVAGPSSIYPIVHKIIMPIIWNYTGTMTLGDYTESITRANSFYSPITFTFVVGGSMFTRIVISTTTGSNGKFTSGWGFRTTVQVH